MYYYEIQCGECDETVVAPYEPGAAKRALWEHTLATHFDKLREDFPPLGYTLKRVLAQKHVDGCLMNSVMRNTDECICPTDDPRMIYDLQGRPTTWLTAPDGR